MPSTEPAAREQRALPRRAALTGLAGGVVGALLRSTMAAAQEDATTTAEAGGEETTLPQTTVPQTTTTAPPRRPTDADRELLAFANTFELAAAELYGMALDVEGLDEDSTALVSAFGDHHRQYGEAIAGLIGSDAPNTPNEAIVRSLRSGFGGDQESVLQAAFELETTAASTHLDLLGQLEGTDGATLVASILPIEARQACVIGEMIGLPLAETVPELETTDAALDPDEFPID